MLKNTSLILAIAFSLCLSSCRIINRTETPQLSAEDRKHPASILTTVASKHIPNSDPDWVRYAPENTNLSFELPAGSEPTELPVPAEASRHFQIMKLYSAKGNGWTALAGYYSGLGTAEPRELARGLMDGLRKAPGISDFQYSLEPGTNSRIPITGSLRQNQIVARLEGFVIADSRDCWILITRCQQTSEKSRAIADRIIESATLEP